MKWLKALSLTAHGKSAKQVADMMGITQDCVVKHLLRARVKLKAKTTAEAIYKAAKSGLICLLIITSSAQQFDDTARISRRGSRTARVVRVARRPKSEKMI